MNKKFLYASALVTLSLISGSFVGNLYASDQAQTVETLQAEIAQLKTLPSSRVNNIKIQTLEAKIQALQNGGTSTVPSPHPTPSPLLTGPQPRPALTESSPVPTMTTETSETLQAEIAQLKTLPSSRMNTTKISALEKKLASLQGGGESTVTSSYSTPSPLLTGPQTTTSTVPSPDPVPNPGLEASHSPLLTGPQPSSSTSVPSASAELGNLASELDHLTKNQDGSKRAVTLDEIDTFIAKVTNLQRDVLETHTKSLTMLEGHALQSLHQQAVQIKASAASADMSEKTSAADLATQQKLAQLNEKIVSMQGYVAKGGEGGLLSKRFGKLGVQDKAAAHTVATDAISLINEILATKPDATLNKKLLEQKKMFESDERELNK